MPLEDLGVSEVQGFRVRRFRVNDLVIGVATDIGPRILLLAPAEDPEHNLFGIVPEFTIETPEGVWRIYGGHRLWISPEAMPRSYSLDDKPIKVEASGSEIRVTGNPEPQNSVRKRIVIRPGPGGGAEVVHEIENIGRWNIEFSCWAVSLMKRGGFAILPIKPRPADERGLLPDRVVALWPYTDPSDPRLVFTKSYVFLRQDPSVERPIKIGVKANPNWVAYWVDGYAFVKSFERKDVPYPDYGSNAEAYTNNLFLELETLGPLRRVAPGAVNRYAERWRIVKVGNLEPREEDVERKLVPAIGKG